MALDSAENREELIEKFQKLAGDSNFHITSRKTPCYNCIAWAMGFDDRWVDCYQDGDKARKKWWPDGVERNFEPETLIKAFEAVGFVKCDDDTPEDEYDKVALYKVSPLMDIMSGKMIADEGWTHAARVYGRNVYHSKIGGAFDILHSSGAVFAGSSYGTTYQFMKRRVADRSISENIQRLVPGFSIPDDILNIIQAIMA